ncbi:Uncharacterised protein [Segatella copri]|nr:Uncharacterised protein [Segatella copri]
MIFIFMEEMLNFILQEANKKRNICRNAVILAVKKSKLYLYHCDSVLRIRCQRTRKISVSIVVD